MKEKLKKNFNEIYWAQTSEMRGADIKKRLPAISLHSHWPSLFSKQGVFIWFKKVIKDLPNILF